MGTVKGIVRFEKVRSPKGGGRYEKVGERNRFRSRKNPDFSGRIGYRKVDPSEETGVHVHSRGTKNKGTVGREGELPWVDGTLMNSFRWQGTTREILGVLPLLM